MPFKLNFQICSVIDFISFWSNCYNQGKYSDDDYINNLNINGLLSPENVQYLLEWKNAKSLSKKKQIIANKVKENITELNKFRQLTEVSVKDFKKFWSLVSTIIEHGIVWKVFLLHITRPIDYPIVDQHVLRAWNFLIKGLVEEPEQTLENYEKYRVLFFELARQSENDFRNVDRALMAFGQFINSQFFQKHLYKQIEISQP